MIKYHPLEDVLDIYIENLDLKHKTVRDYKLLLNRYIYYLKSRNIRYAKRSDIITYRDSMWEEDLSATTIQKQMVIIRNFYKWIRINRKFYHFEEIYEHDVSEGLKGAKIEKNYKKEALTLSEAQALIELSKSKVGTMFGLRNYAILLLMLTTGLRTIEVARAKRRDLSTIDKHDVLYVQGKGKDGSDMFVKISKPVKAVIQEYLFLRSDKNKFLFITNHQKETVKPITTDTIRYSLKRLMDEAQVSSPKVTVHSLRHTCATLSLQTGGSLEATQQLLRHANIETTLIYAHHLNRIKDDTVDRISNYLFQEKEEEEC
ncbi:MAG: tyrosine-type recombinase/integrase [Candidatus Izemoplasmatales bacterium]|jgi:site-specific recombinase XerD